eukprot:5019088-Pleurochrysis_carterae.AAC.1
MPSTQVESSHAVHSQYADDASVASVIIMCEVVGSQSLSHRKSCSSIAASFVRSAHLSSASNRLALGCEVNGGGK